MRRRVLAHLLTACLLAAGCNALTGAGDFTFASEEQPTGPKDSGSQFPDTPLEGDPPYVRPDASTDPSPVDSGADDADAAAPRGPLRVFVTSQTKNGNLGGVTGADQFCKQLADAAGLTTTGIWTAWLSTSAGDAIDRISANGPWLNLAGNVVANDKAQLTSAKLDNKINRTEKNEGVDASNDRVWTGTTSNGRFDTFACNMWTTSASNVGGRVGEAAFEDEKWTDTSPEPIESCANQNRVYCFEQ